MRGGANVFGAWVAFTSMLIWEDVSAGSHEFDWKIMKTTTKEQHMGAPRQQPRPRLQLTLAFFAFILIGANDGAVGVLLPSMIAQYHFASPVVSSNSTSV